MSDIDHRAFVAALPQDVRARLTAKSDARGLAHLAGHWGLLALTGTAIALQVPFWWALLPVHGVALVFLFTLLHETSHDTPFASKRLCDAVGGVCAFLLVLTPTWFRFFHLAHHRHTQVPGKDPELAEPRPATWGEYARHLTGLPIWRAHVANLLRHAAGRCDEDYVPARRRADVVREARITVALYATLAVFSVAAGSTLLVWVWIVPALIGQPVLRLYLLAEHGACPFVANMLENTRTTHTNRIVRFLAWNMPFHAEHHAFPAVPFHNLPALSRLVAPHAGVTSDGYAAFHRDFATQLRTAR